MSTSHRRGKEHERAIAKRLGGERTGNRGVAAADVVNGRFAIECKSRKALPSWLVKAMLQAENGATDGRVPVTIVHETGIRHEDDLVVMRLKDFETMAVNQMPRLSLDMPDIDLSKYLDDFKMPDFPDCKLSQLDFDLKKLSDFGSFDSRKKDRTP